MSATSELLAEVLSDHMVDEYDVALIRRVLAENGRLDLDDVKLLVEIYCQAWQSCPAFDDLFFDVLESVLLGDGEIQPSEQFYLLKMLYSDRVIREREKNFLLELKRRVKHSSPEFEAICSEAFRANPTQWDVGGRCGEPASK